jgi:hypothetical protein
MEIDRIIGQPQREMQKTVEFELYVKNLIVKTLVETFNYLKLRELSKPLTNVKVNVLLSWLILTQTGTHSPIPSSHIGINEATTILPKWQDSIQGTSSENKVI